MVEFELRGPGPPGSACNNPKTSYFHEKTKISEKNFRGLSSKLLHTAKYTAKDNVPYFPSPGPSQLQKFIKKMLRFKRVYKQRED